jgi:histidyl-tRNA synthetase
VLFVNFGPEEEAYCLPVLARLRRAGINSEIFPDYAKMKKQMTYADKKKIPFVVLAGAAEMAENKLNLKDMDTGEQHLVNFEELIKIVS